MNDATSYGDMALRTIISVMVASAANLYCNKAYSGDGSLLTVLKKPVSNEHLVGERGAGDTKVVNLNDVRGSVQNNTASDLVTGSNVITNGSFTGTQGFPTVIQNSGNNVLIQSSTIINIGMQP